MSSNAEAVTVREILRASQSQAAASGDDLRLDAELLLAQVLGCSRAWLFAFAETLLSTTQRQRFEALWSRRISGEPLAYLLGEREFWSLPLRVTAATLIPRPETERLVELALERLPLSQSSRVLDLGTGSGAIALAVAKERPDVFIVATDRSADALAVAAENARSLGIHNIEFRCGDWWQAVADECFDLILSNPPYLAEQDPHLQGDLRFEPREALVSGPEGLDAIAAICDAALQHMTPGASLLIEHGQSQGAAVRERMVSSGLIEVTTASDLEGRDRVTLGRAGEVCP